MDLIDTCVAIHLRDGDRAVEERVAALETLPVLSVLTRVELEGGIFLTLEFAAIHRANTDALLSRLAILPFDGACADAYAKVLAVTGWSRPKIFDRMIAATALAHDVTPSR